MDTSDSPARRALLSDSPRNSTDTTTTTTTTTTTEENNTPYKLYRFLSASDRLGDTTNNTTFTRNHHKVNGAGLLIDVSNEDSNDADSNYDIVSNGPKPAPVEDVCYSPNTHRAPEDELGIDYEALNAYVINGEVDTMKGRRNTKKVGAVKSYSHATGSTFLRRDSKGFAGGRPTATETRRFSFYSKSTGQLHSDSFAEIGLTPDHRERYSNATYAEREAEFELRRKNFAKVIAAGNFWLDILAPTDSEMKAFSKIFGIHHLTLEDIQNEEDHEKCELFHNYYFVSIRTFDQDHYSPTYLQPISYYMVVMKEGIISFHYRQTPHTHNVQKRIWLLREYINVTPDWITYALLDDITDSFAPLIRQLEAEVDSIDELVLILNESEQSDMLQRIGHARRSVMSLLRLLGTKVDVIKNLVKRVPSNIRPLASLNFADVGPDKTDANGDNSLGEDIALYCGDVLDHVLGMLSSLNHFEMILGRAHSNYLAQISIEITQSANKTNKVLTKITVLGSIIVPMNVITGLWGMNVPVPGQPDAMADLTWFMGIVVGLVVFTFACLCYVRRAQIA